MNETEMMCPHFRSRRSCEICDAARDAEIAEVHEAFVNAMTAQACLHGGLRRSCEICDLQAQLVDAAALHLADEQSIRNLTERLAKVEAERDALRADMSEAQTVRLKLAVLERALAKWRAEAEAA